MITVYVESLAVVGPGLVDWNQAAAVLRDLSTYVPTKVVLDGAAAMTANERRRTTPLIRLALQVVEQLSTHSSFDLSSALSVFATSWGDPQVMDNVMCALTLPGLPVSPVQFHNIVHNTAAGYWSIGSGARGLSTSLTAANTTVAAGLIEAFVCLSDSDAPLLLVCYDHPLPASWDKFHHIETPFAAAMALTTTPTERCRCAMSLELIPQQPETRMAQPGLEALRLGNPAARALPLLQAIATGASGRVILPSNIGVSCLAVDIFPMREQEQHDDPESRERVLAAIATPAGAA
jgi:hypothetical protein